MANFPIDPPKFTTLRYIPEVEQEHPIDTRARIYLGSSQRWIEIRYEHDNLGRIEVRASGGIVVLHQSSNVCQVELTDVFERREDRRIRDLAERVFDEFQAAGADFNGAIALAQTIAGQEYTKRAALPAWVKQAAATLARRFKWTPPAEGNDTL